MTAMVLAETTAKGGTTTEGGMTTKGGTTTIGGTTTKGGTTIKDGMTTKGGMITTEIISDKSHTLPFRFSTMESTFLRGKMDLMI